MGVDFQACPEEGVVRVHVVGEILEALDFDAESLFIRYQVELPGGWSVDNE